MALSTMTDPGSSEETFWKVLFQTGWGDAMILETVVSWL